MFKKIWNWFAAQLFRLYIAIGWFVGSLFGSVGIVAFAAGILIPIAAMLIAIIIVGASGLLIALTGGCLAVVFGIIGLIFIPNGFQQIRELSQEHNGARRSPRSNGSNN